MSQDEIQRSLGSIEQSLKEILRRLDAHDLSESRLAIRVANLERWRAYLTGAWIVLAAGLVYLKELFTK